MKLITNKNGSIALHAETLADAVRLMGIANESGRTIQSETRPRRVLSKFPERSATAGIRSVFFSMEKDQEVSISRSEWPYRSRPNSVLSWVSRRSGDGRRFKVRKNREDFKIVRVQ
jgi:hypothetical protein